ncbi:MAG: hypothetical protein MHMPM18_005206 [Marteilia pararefringens]
MDNQSTSGSDEWELEESSGSDDVVKLERLEICLKLISCSLVTSFLLQGMSISYAVVNLQEQNKFDALSTTSLILSILLIALQFFFSLLFVWCRFKFNRIFGGVIAVFVILIQIAIIVLACKFSHESVLAASICTSVVNLLFVIAWSGSFFQVSSDFERYINQTGIYRDSFKISYLNILVFSSIVWKQALIGFLSVMLQLQNPFSYDFSNALYFISIIIHLLSHIVLILEFGFPRLLSRFDLISQKSIVTVSLYLITFIGFMIFSCVERSKLSSLQLTIWLILIATFFLEFILTICIVMKAYRKPQDPTSDDIEMRSLGSTNDQAPQSKTRFPTTKV